MNKKIKTFGLTLGLLASIGVCASAAIGPTASGQSGGGTGYSGYVEGDIGFSSCYAATTTTRTYGTEDVYAYVEVVNKDGYAIGSGSANTGTDYAYSGTITRSGGKNAYGSIGTASGSSRTFTALE